MARAISKILFILGWYNFLAYLECVRRYAWSKGHSEPDLSSVLPWDISRDNRIEVYSFLLHLAICASVSRDKKSLIKIKAFLRRCIIWENFCNSGPKLFLFGRYCKLNHSGCYGEIIPHSYSNYYIWLEFLYHNNYNLKVSRRQ